jgi:hypothetical protein
MNMECDIIPCPKWNAPAHCSEILEGADLKGRFQPMYGDVTAPGRELHARFIAVGDMTGKTGDQIIAAVGAGPTSISSMAQGMTLLQWQATGCHMAILFGPDGKFVKVTHQYANYAPAPAGCFTLVVVLVAALVAICAALR